MVGFLRFARCVILVRTCHCGCKMSPFNVASTRGELFHARPGLPAIESPQSRRCGSTPLTVFDGLLNA